MDKKNNNLALEGFHNGYENDKSFIWESKSSATGHIFILTLWQKWASSLLSTARDILQNLTVLRDRRKYSKPFYKRGENLKAFNTIKMPFVVLLKSLTD
jgi:hypothetical protein